MLKTKIYIFTDNERYNNRSGQWIINVSKISTQKITKPWVNYNTGVSDSPTIVHGLCSICMPGRGTVVHDWERRCCAWLGEAQLCMIGRDAAMHDWARRSWAWLGEAQLCMIGEEQLCMIRRGAAMYDWARHSGAWLGEAQLCMTGRGAAVHDWAKHSCAWPV